MKAKKRKPYRAYVPAKFAPWAGGETHVHTTTEVRVQTGNHTLVIDRCTGPNCEYERARDLITPEGGANADNS